MFAILLLVVAIVVSLLLVPLGLPGLWLMLGAGLLYWVLVPAGGIGLVTFLIACALVVAAETLEFTIAGSYARKFGGSKRASWGAILGGIVGAIVGVPIPFLGSVIGAFVGSFVGAFAGELTVRAETRGDPAKVATGALLGRAVATAVKSAIGVVVAVLLVSAAVIGYP